MKKKTTRKKSASKRYLTAPLGKDFVRGFIPHSVRATDRPDEVAVLFGIHIVTARNWIRILKGPQISRNGKIINKWTPPDFGAPTKKGRKTSS